MFYVFLSGTDGVIRRSICALPVDCPKPALFNIFAIWLVPRIRRQIFSGLRARPNVKRVSRENLVQSGPWSGRLW